MTVDSYDPDAAREYIAHLQRLRAIATQQGWTRLGIFETSEPPLLLGTMTAKDTTDTLFRVVPHEWDPRWGTDPTEKPPTATP